MQTYASDNWSKLVKDYEPLIGKIYIDDDGNEYEFIGLLHGEDDFYYVMYRDGNIKMLTCVGVPEMQGFNPK